MSEQLYREFVNMGKQVEDALSRAFEPSKRRLEWRDTDGQDKSVEVTHKEVEAKVDKLLRQGVDPATIKLWKMAKPTVTVGVGEDHRW